MNPGFLFPDIEASSWEHLSEFENENAPPWINVICRCQDKISFKPCYEAPTIASLNKGRVEVRPLRIVYKNKDAYIYVGQCKDCKKVFWASWQYDWTMWMTSQQHWEMLLSEARNAKYRVERGERTRIVIMDKGGWGNTRKREFTIIFNRQGGVEYLTYHDYDYTKPAPPDDPLCLGDLLS
jgi:hypothetical protein